MKQTYKTHSPAETAEILGLSKKTIYRAIKIGELPVIRINARVIRISAIDSALWFATKKCPQVAQGEQV